MTHPGVAASEPPVLRVRDLRVRVGTTAVEVVRGVSFDIGLGERVALVGESGSGKTVTALSVMGILKGGSVTGSITFQGRELVGMPEDRRRRLRGDRVSYIFQDPLSAMNPSMRMIDQVAESLVVRGQPRRAANERAAAMLRRVGLDASADTRYPHQLSGGMRQRAMIASALLCDPALVLADEPTTALDAQLRVQVLQLLRDLADEHAAALLFITHDLSLMAGFADRILVMYAGRIVETLRAIDTTLDARHPYTRALLRSVPRIDGQLGARLEAIPGAPPRPGMLPPGCPFGPRCARVTDECSVEEPPLIALGADHAAACIHLGPGAASAAADVAAAGP